MSELEKVLIKGILSTGRMLVYRHELELPEDYEIDNTYIFYNNNESDFDIIMDPDIIKLDDKELKIFREIFVIDEDMNIDKVSELVTKYVIRKMQTCTKTGHVYSLLLEKAKKFYNVEEDDNEYNERTYSFQFYPRSTIRFLHAYYYLPLISFNSIQDQPQDQRSRQLRR